MKDLEIKAIIRAVDEATGPIKKITRSVERMGKSVSNIGRKMTIGISAPLAAIGTLGVKSFGDWDESMRNVSTLVDTNIEDMGKLSSEAMKIAKDIPRPLNETAAALYDIRSAGIGASDQMEVLNKSGRLGVAGLGTVKEATDLMTSSMNAFNLTAEETAELDDTIFKTIKSGKTTISQLSQGFGSVAGTVSHAGIKLDDYLASVAAITTIGNPASQAHTQIGSAISSLTRETEESKNLFKYLGVTTFPELIKKSGGVVGAFEKISKVYEGNDDRLIKLVGSKEAFAAIVALAGKQNAKYVETLNDMRDGAREVDKAFEKQANGFNAQMQLMSNAINGSLGNSIGKVLAPHIKKFTAYVGELANKFDSLPKGIKEIITFSGLAIAAIGPLLVGLGAIAAMIGFITLPVLAVTAVIAGLAALAYVLYDNWSDALGRNLAMVAAALMAVFAPVTAVVAAIAMSAYLIYDNWEGISDFFADIMTSITLNVIATVAKISAYISGIFDSIYNIWEDITSFLSDKIDALTNILPDWLKDSLGIGNVSQENTTTNMPDHNSGSRLDQIAQTTNPENRAKADVTVDFKGVPRGTKINSNVSGRGLNFNVGRGYAFGG